MMISKDIFSDRDIIQIKDMGKKLDDLLTEIELFKKGAPFLKIVKPATIGDGIVAISETEMVKIINLYKERLKQYDFIKFVPASGAASRMFRSLFTIYNHHYPAKIDDIKPLENKDKQYKEFLEFAYSIKRFPFYQDLNHIMAQHKLSIEEEINKGIYGEILRYLLTSDGLNYGHLPKALIKFHAYPDHIRTALEEHIVEATLYIKNRDNQINLHFTILPEHEKIVKSFYKNIKNLYEKRFNLVLNTDFSMQEPSTNTIAVDMNNHPIRDKNKRLLFRPGGHGALLKNLNSINADFIFIKNIDNVTTDRYKPIETKYKKVLAGYLIYLQEKIFNYLKKIEKDELDDKELNELILFSKGKLNIIFPQNFALFSKKEKESYIYERLNRPIRVCGMVKNEGEPGGGPFWVEGYDSTPTLQIIESSQIDMSSDKQKKIFNSSTHFNPVDIVCGIRNYKGEKFDLTKFADHSSVFISIKFKEGMKLKALELPGLWNGAMAYWTTVFVEVPIETFNPVKIVNDLLRERHQSN